MSWAKCEYKDTAFICVFADVFKLDLFFTVSLGTGVQCVCLCVRSPSTGLQFLLMQAASGFFLTSVTSHPWEIVLLLGEQKAAHSIAVF